MLETAIKNFPKQFAYDPAIENAGQFKKSKKFIVAGMGGSHLAGDILKTWNPSLDIIIHKNYGLPDLSEEELKSRLVIASSYSGNTEETLDAFKTALTNKVPVVAVSTGGKLLEMAKAQSAPYIQLPDLKVEPRLALGVSFRAFLKIIGDESALQESGSLAAILKPENYEKTGKDLAQKLADFVPVIYASERNQGIAYNWKIKFNETGKIPAFYNVFPELNHNEMTGFDAVEATKNLSKPFYFILLKDVGDHPRVIRRMEVLEKLYRERGLSLESIALEGKNKLHKIFSSLVLADWVTHFTAEHYGVESEAVPMVEEFKKLI